MGMYATINDQEIKFSGLLGSAYARLYGMDVPTVIELDHNRQIALIFELANLIDSTPIINNHGGVNLQSVISRASDCHKLVALIEFATDPETANKPLVFA